MTEIINDTREIGYCVASLIAKNNWTCTGVVTLSFASIAEYMSARADLMRAMVPGLVMPRSMADGYGEEVDIAGVTFRIRCLQKRTMQDGVYSDVELARSDRLLHRPNIGDWMP
jgi:hypothetical protein